MESWMHSTDRAVAEFGTLGAGVPDCLLFGVQKYLSSLTQMPGLVSVETVSLTSPRLPWFLVLEDPSRLYTAREKQRLQPKLLPLPSCHHLLTVTRSNWEPGDGDRRRRKAREWQAGLTGLAVWMPSEAGQGVPLDVVWGSLQPFSCLPVGRLCVSRRHRPWGRHRQLSVPGVGLERPQEYQDPAQDLAPA